MPTDRNGKKWRMLIIGDHLNGSKWFMGKSNYVW